ncbi:MAG: hypothetical protein ABSA01_11275 [Anaerolineales bacterium]
MSNLHISKCCFIGHVFNLDGMVTLGQPGILRDGRPSTPPAL